ncbi:MAG TPA: hypothetical protein VJB64_02580 [Patescibacteria group bacterium]|nr:hypothetical protein [Patescibacteria group bacterium]
MKKSFLPLSLLSVVLIGGGCFNTVTETTIERQIESETGGSADVDIQDNAITYTDEETGGTVTTGSDISLPDDFPTDFFVYDGDITIISAANIPEQGVSLMFSSEDSLEDIATWYEEELTSDGWTRDQGHDLQGQLVRSYVKENFRMAVSLAEDAGVTTGTIVRSEE